MGWVGMFAPTGTPRAVVEDVRQAIFAVLARQVIVDKLIQQGAEAATAADQPGFAAFLTADRKKWKDPATDAGIKDPD
jgi:tripartite-type tricarboxylate transporter receptor subunit TctC